LDIGCAEGSFVNAGKRVGLDVRGIEPSHELVEWGINNHQLRITQGDYQTYIYDDAPYDLVTLWDVIEHVESPSHLLEQMRRVIKEGGLLLINTPIIDSWQAKTMSKNWPFLLNVHTFYYSGRTLTEHCSKFGFQLVENRKYSQTLSLGFLLLRFGFPLKLSKPLFPIPLRYSLGQQTFLFRREIND
jgi:2-polyprenyl-3-methyl-5-hydroxy-6-metoxy-1,4-benzoquinol methylase